jgi:hypothetical protein
MPLLYDPKALARLREKLEREAAEEQRLSKDEPSPKLRSLLRDLAFVHELSQ